MSTGEAFGRRFGAAFIDGILIYVINQIVQFGMMASMRPGAGGAPSPGEMFAVLGAAFVVNLAIGIGYYCGMLVARGQTLGKMALGIRVVARDGGNPSFGTAFLREIIGKLVSGIPLCLGYLWMLWDPEQQTWHDKMAGTHVERA